MRRRATSCVRRRLHSDCARAYPRRCAMSVATAVDAGTPPGESSGAPRAAGLDALASVAAQLASPTSTAGKTSSRSFLDELLGAEPPPRPRPPRGAPPRLAPRRIADPLSATLDPAAGQGIVSERAARDVRGRVANAAGDLHLFGGRASAAASDATAPLRRESLEPERQPPPSPLCGRRSTPRASTSTRTRRCDAAARRPASPSPSGRRRPYRLPPRPRRRGGREARTFARWANSRRERCDRRARSWRATTCASIRGGIRAVAARGATARRRTAGSRTGCSFNSTASSL